MNNFNLKSPIEPVGQQGTILDLKGGIQGCYTCNDAINPNTVFKRFHLKFCSDECLDLFDERNDFGHQNKYCAEMEGGYHER